MEATATLSGLRLVCLGPEEGLSASLPEGLELRTSSVVEGLVLGLLSTSLAEALVQGLLSTSREEKGATACPPDSSEKKETKGLTPPSDTYKAETAPVLHVLLSHKVVHVLPRTVPALPSRRALLLRRKGEAGSGLGVRGAG